MTCACPPFSALTAPPCCRDNGPLCDLSRCLHPEPTASTLFAQLQETEALFVLVRERHRQAQLALQEAANTVIAVGQERERLWDALRAQMGREAGARGEEPERGSGTRSEGVGEAVALPDLGG